MTADSLMLLTQDNYITNDGQTKIIRTGQSGHVLNNYILPPSKLIVGENSTNFKYVANYEPNSSISDYVNKLSPEDYNHMKELQEKAESDSSLTDIFKTSGWENYFAGYFTHVERFPKGNFFYLQPYMRIEYTDLFYEKFGKDTDLYDGWDCGVVEREHIRSILEKIILLSESGESISNESYKKYFEKINFLKDIYVATFMPHSSRLTTFIFWMYVNVPY